MACGACEDWCPAQVHRLHSCHYGQFRNGELATRCIGREREFGDVTLITEPPLGPAIRRP